MGDLRLCQKVSCDVAECTGCDMLAANESKEIDGFAFAMRDIVNEFFVDSVLVSGGEKYGIDIISVIRVDGVDQATAI